MSIDSFLKKYHLGLIVAFLYFIAGYASLVMLHGKEIINIGVFASEGIALAFALFYGRKILWGIFLGQLLLALYNGVPFVASAAIALTNSLEAYMAIVLFQRYNIDISFRKTRDILAFIALVAFVLQPFSAIVGNNILLVSGVIEQESFWRDVVSWWFGNVMGQLLFTPFVLLFFEQYEKIRLKKFFLYGAVFGVFLYLIEVVFQIESILFLQSLTIPVLIYIVFSQLLVCGLFFTVILAVISAYSVYLGVGAFYINSQINNVINYNLFVLLHLIIVFTAGVLFERQKELEKELHQKVSNEVEKTNQHKILLIQQSRLAQMGEMIAMIAHQWRQPLNNLSLANQLLITKYKKGKLNDEVMEFFETNSQKQIILMSQTIDDFRNFFKAKKTKEQFSLNEALKGTISLVEASYKALGITIQLSALKEYFVYGYQNELSQAVLNIINNAKDVLVEQKELMDKQISIDITEEDKEVVIAISDNGGGIDEAIMSKIFDPYFTTKDSKNGTGLGLYMTKMIIEQKLDGKIRVMNNNEGAVFKIYLKGNNQDA